jgi:uncharacterized RDD family membrane protein YckC
MDKVEFISAQHVKIEFEMASVLQRGLAYVLDTAIGYVYLIIVMLSLIDSVRVAYSDMDVLVGLFILLVNLPIVLYKPMMEYFFNGQTLGKMAMGIRMVRVNGDRMTIRDIFVRWVMRGEFFWISLVSNPAFIGLIPFISAIDLLVASMTPLRQRVGDMMVSVIAIRTKPNRTFTLKEVLSRQTEVEYVPTYEKCITFTDEDMMYLKKVIEQYKKFKEPEVKELLDQVTLKTQQRLEIDEPITDQIKFLETVLKDYVQLTR